MSTGKRVKYISLLFKLHRRQNLIKIHLQKYDNQLCFLLGKEMVDYIADYLEAIRDRRVFPDVKPGYMRELVNDTAPTDGEDWDCIFKDVERVIMPGVSFTFHQLGVKPE